jgi:hypothetical protein
MRPLIRIAPFLFAAIVTAEAARSQVVTNKPAVTGTGVKIVTPPSERTLVADETEVVASGKTGFRIITCNDVIANKLMKQFENNGMTKFTYVQKKDRHGKYWERSLYFKNESWNDVAGFINAHCK